MIREPGAASDSAFLAPYAADLAIPHPTMDRTKFSLVDGGKSPAVLELFRDIEKKVVGGEAAGVREHAASRQTTSRTGQLALIVAPRRRTRTTIRSIWAALR